MTRRKRRSGFELWIGRVLRSRTVWVALGQATLAAITALTTANPGLEAAAWMLVLKSFLVDIVLRVKTTQPIGKGQP